MLPVFSDLVIAGLDSSWYYHSNTGTTDGAIKAGQDMGVFLEDNRKTYGIPFLLAIT